MKCATSTLTVAVLGATLLAASTPGPATAAPERAAGYSTYVACSHSKKAPPSHSCGKAEKKAAFFVSENADVLYDICLKVPDSDRKLCARAQEAKQGKKYRNTITSDEPGKHTVTWFVDDQLVGSFSFRVRAN
jgi:hypothetical protein